MGLSQNLKKRSGIDGPDSAVLEATVGLIALFCGLMLATPARGTTANSATDPTRNSLQSEYLEHRSNRASFFSTAPIYHIIPERDVITLGTDATFVDTQITSPTTTFEQALNDERSLNLSGWDTALLTGFSAKNFGVGFSAELGRKNVEYLFQQDDYNAIQASQTKYSGLGFYLYHIPKIPLLPKYVNVNLILGYRKLNVSHDYSGYLSQQTTAPTRPFSYDLQTMDVGTNIAITLAKRFTVLPWFNWRRVILGEPEETRVDWVDIAPSHERGNFEADREILWTADPALTYGLDFAVGLGGLDIHFGGLFGMITNFSKGNENIEENGFTASLSYSLKSK